MRAIGMFTTLLLVAGAVAAVVIGYSSRDDVKRYLKIRSM